MLLRNCSGVLRVSLACAGNFQITANNLSLHLIITFHPKTFFLSCFFFLFFCFCFRSFFYGETIKFVLFLRTSSFLVSILKKHFQKTFWENVFLLVNFLIRVHFHSQYHLSRILIFFYIFHLLNLFYGYLNLVFTYFLINLFILNLFWALNCLECP